MYKLNRCAIQLEYSLLHISANVVLSSDPGAVSFKLAQETL